MTIYTQRKTNMEHKTQLRYSHLQQLHPQNYYHNNKRIDIHFNKKQIKK